MFSEKRVSIKTIEWLGNYIKIIDQTKIPKRLTYLNLYTIEDVFVAVQKLKVRGAPAIGVVAAFGLFLGLNNKTFTNKNSLLNELRLLKKYLLGARPTAVNLEWALQTVISEIERTEGSIPYLRAKILELAISLQEDDLRRCKLIGHHGSKLIFDGAKVLTHCNTGMLATTGIGTALGIIFTAWGTGKRFQVFVDETRPLLQGARLTMWELDRAEIPATLITDSTAAYAMKIGKVDLVIVGADRIAANGDVANKIGTYNLAINCRYHNIPFYVAAPLSTFDFTLSSGKKIPIEERASIEITNIWDKLNITVAAAETWNPAFDVTPADLITGIISEEGIFTYPFENSLEKLKIFSKLSKNLKESIL